MSDCVFNAYNAEAEVMNYTAMRQQTDKQNKQMQTEDPTYLPERRL